MAGKVLLAYSGGLDTSVAIKWIHEKYNVDVVTMTVDVGQNDDYTAIEQKALSTGALKHYFIDAREEFVEEYVHRAVKANALYEGKYPMGTALARPLIARKLVDLAKKEGATAVAHGCTGKGNDQIRFDVTIKSLDPSLKIIAPIREWKLSRDEEIKYAKANGIPIPVDLDNPYSIDQNIWGRAIECGMIEEADREPPEDVFNWTTKPEKSPDKPEYLKIQFDHGVPVSLNGKNLGPVRLIETVNEVAGQHGVGRIDHLEDRTVGFKSREVYECPAATVLIETHGDLEKAVLTPHELFFKREVDTRWTYLAYAGLWMDPLRDALEAFIDKTQERVSGEVTVKLYKGSATVVGRSSPVSLYDMQTAAYGVETSFDQSWSTGFIELWGMPTRLANVQKAKAKKLPVKAAASSYLVSQETSRN